MAACKIAGALIGAALALVPALRLSAAPLPDAPSQIGSTICVEPVAAGAGENTLSHVFVVATSTALGARGFTILDDPGHAAYIAEVTLRQEEVGTARSTVKAGGPSMAGVGVSIPFSSGQYSLVPLLRIQLDVRIRKRAGPAVLWHGAAVTVRSASRNGSEEQMASALSVAALQGYPNQSAELAGVP